MSPACLAAPTTAAVPVTAIVAERGDTPGFAIIKQEQTVAPSLFQIYRRANAARFTLAKALELRLGPIPLRMDA